MERRVVVEGNARDEWERDEWERFAAAAATRRAPLSRFPLKTCRRGDRAGTHCPRFRLTNAHFSPFISSRTTSPGAIVGTSRGGPSGGGGAPGRPPSSETSDSPEVIPRCLLCKQRRPGSGRTRRDDATMRTRPREDECASTSVRVETRRRRQFRERASIVKFIRGRRCEFIFIGLYALIILARTPRGSRGTPAPSTRARTDPPSAVCARCAPLRETRSRARVRAGTAR